MKLLTSPLRLLLLVGGLLMAFALASYYLPSCQQRGVVREAQQLTKERQQAQAAGQQQQHKYQLDSTRLATEARGIAQRDSSLKAQQHALLQYLSTHPPLPAWDALPSAN